MPELTLRTHWLAEVAGLAALPMLDTAAVSKTDVWAAVAEAAGLSGHELGEKVAAHYRLPLADLGGGAPAARALLPEKVARHYAVVPLRASDRELTVAISDPNDLNVEQALAFASARTPVFEIAPPEEILKAIDELYAPDRLMEQLVGRMDSAVADDIRLIEDLAPEAVSALDVDSTPVVKLTNLILHEAVLARASDIHIEPTRDGGIVRFRVDGMLRTIMKVPASVLRRIVPRIKIMAKLDIADRLRPQDGRARLQVEGTTLDLRISTVPTRDAEKAVIRLLDPRNARKLEEMGVLPDDLERLRLLFGNSTGIVVVTGPTGSGKTTLLYAALRELATGETNIMTVEDPIEYELPGLTQIQVEPKRDLTFATSLRSILRQDPDVIFVGEIRDMETAEMAVQASLTGHLVLSTLHANDAVGAIGRFVDLGVDRSKIAATLRGAIAQRLVRRACPDCAAPVGSSLTPREAELVARYGVTPVVRAVGCKTCGMTGYKGRLPLIEVLIANHQIESLIATGASEADLQAVAGGGGFRSLMENALERVRMGQTTLEEVGRVLGVAGRTNLAVAEVASGEQLVLLVDDDQVTRTVARSVLEQAGYRVEEAADGATALDTLGDGARFALMVLDLGLPGMGGREVLAKVRGSVSTACLPVLVLTGSTTDEAESQLLEEGADDFIRKPLDPARFVARVKAALRRTGG